MTDPAPTADGLTLVTDADQHSQADWESSAAAVLRKSGRLTGDDPDSAVWDALSTDTLAGVTVPPLGHPRLVAGVPPTGAPGAAPYARGRLATRPEHGWDIRPLYAGVDARATNEAVLTDLENGATSVWVSMTRGGLGPADLPRVLDRVLLDLAPVTLEAST